MSQKWVEAVFGCILSYNESESVLWCRGVVGPMTEADKTSEIWLLFLKWTKWTKMNKILKSLKLSQNRSGPVSIDTRSVHGQFDVSSFFRNVTGRGYIFDSESPEFWKQMSQNWVEPILGPNSSYNELESVLWCRGVVGPLTEAAKTSEIWILFLKWTKWTKMNKILKSLGLS